MKEKGSDESDQFENYQDSEEENVNGGPHLKKAKKKKPKKKSPKKKKEVTKESTTHAIDKSYGSEFEMVSDDETQSKEGK